MKKQLIKKLEKELKLWTDLKKYVAKKMSGKTLTKDIEKQINYMIKDRADYIKRLKND